MAARITQTAFDPHAEVAAFSAQRQGAGALASFVGYCRDATAGRTVSALHIEHYSGFSETRIAELAADISKRFALLDLLVVHRVGDIGPGEAIVLVAALSAHRNDSFEAVRLLMDYLKTDAPLWKKETGPDGARWIEHSAEDQARRTRAEKASAKQ